ncbi:MAG TPA: DUF4124 domain-containing protein [Xanthomonadaceae bacterium]|nr:DUF4124 domain-containing protein [Xanthomonadaceae bacterium]
MRQPCPRRVLTTVLASTALAIALPRADVQAADGVTIYRCTDAARKLTLRDTPCRKGERQQTREMLRPKDAPLRTRVAAPRRDPRTQAAPSVVFISAPRPLYECLTPDGANYTSDSGEGNPRWVPLWTLGYPVLVEAPIMTPGGGYVRYQDGRVDGALHSGGVRYGVVPTPAAYGAGTWVRDQCHALPQQDVCARLVDRRDELRRRFFNAQQNERDRMRLEERSLNARLDQDCG